MAKVGRRGQGVAADGRPDRRRGPRVWPWALALSLLAHVLVLQFSLPAPAKTPDQKLIEVLTVPLEEIKLPEPTPAELLELQKEEKQKEEEKKQEEEKKKEEDLKNGQVVDLGPEDPNDQTPPPPDSRYLAERNMKTDRETVKPGRPSSTPTPPTPPPQAAPPPKAIPPPTRPPAATATPKPPAPPPPPEDARDPDVASQPPVEVAAATPPTEAVPAPTAPDTKLDEAPIEIAQRDEQRLSKSELQVTMADLSKDPEEDTGSIDYLPDIFKGDFTSLNARRYTYAAFYNRIKKMIAFYWSPYPALQASGWRGARLETRLRMVLNENGELIELEVIQTSGFPLVDAAAVTAVRKATPFFGVPKPLLDERGRLDEVWAFFITPD